MTEEEKKFEEYGGKPYGTIKCPFWTDGKTLKDKDVNVHHPSTCTKCWNGYDYNCYYPNNFKCDQYNEMVKTIKPEYLKAIVDIIRRDTNFVISSECKNDCNHGILKCPIHKACKHYDDFDQDVCNNGAGIPRLYSEYENCINYKKPEPTVEICSCVGNEMCSICSKKVGKDKPKMPKIYADMPTCPECKSNTNVKLGDINGFYFCSACKSKFALIETSKHICPDCGNNIKIRILDRKEMYYCYGCSAYIYPESQTQELDEPRDLGSLDYCGVVISVHTDRKDRSIAFSINEGTDHEVNITIFGEDEEF
ncbi:hypothetical protein LCGC14_1629520 [marine sediment metagenome]|uniref:Uncharacterized protein n=1 Tax=marine sediment metagenome TaxID=412755 RepID=A0A0F9I3G1_9ZZZZ